MAAQHPSALWFVSVYIGTVVYGAVAHLSIHVLAILTLAWAFSFSVAYGQKTMLEIVADVFKSLRRKNE